MSDQMQSEIAQLNRELEKDDDPRVCYAKVREKIRDLRQAGWQIPDELASIEHLWMTECVAASQGR